MFTALASAFTPVLASGLYIGGGVVGLIIVIVVVVLTSLYSAAVPEPNAAVLFVLAGGILVAVRKP